MTKNIKRFLKDIKTGKDGEKTKENEAILINAAKTRKCEDSNLNHVPKFNPKVTHVFTRSDQETNQVELANYKYNEFI